MPVERRTDPNLAQREATEVKTTWLGKVTTWFMDPQSTWHARWMMRLISFAVLALIFLGGYFLLHLAGVFQSYLGHPIVKRTQDTQDASTIDGSIIGAAVTWTGGLIALLTYFYTYYQKERQHKSQLSATKSLEDERRQQDKEFELLRDQRERELETDRRSQERTFEEDRERRERDFEAAREKRDRDLAELQRLETEFAALVTDFTSDKQASQLNAIIGLSEIAKRPDPRRVNLGQDLPEIDVEHYKAIRVFIGQDGNIQRNGDDWPESWKTYKTERNYPYFLKVASRLLIAIRLWGDEECRIQAIDSLKALADWGKDESTDEPLLHELANLAAESQRRSWLALGSQVKEDAVSADEVLSLLRLANIESRFAKTLPASMVTPDLTSSCVAQFVNLLLNLNGSARISDNAFSVHLAENEIITNDNPRILPFLWTYWTVSDILGIVLMTLSPPPELSLVNQDTLDSTSEDLRLFADVVSRRRNLKLEKLRLLTFRSIGLNLQFSQLSRTQFLACNLLGCDFSFAQLETTCVVGSYCENCRLVRSSCFDSQFIRSNLRASSFGYAELSFSDFSEATLYEVDFSMAQGEKPVFIAADFGTDVRGCNMNETRFISPNFSKAAFGRTTLAGAWLSTGRFGRSKEDFTDMGTSTWESGNFELFEYRQGTRDLVPSNEYNKDLWEYFNALTPVPEGHPARIPPWEKPASPSA